MMVAVEAVMMVAVEAVVVESVASTNRVMALIVLAALGVARWVLPKNPRSSLSRFWVMTAVVLLQESLGASITSWPNLVHEFGAQVSEDRAPMLERRQQSTKLLLEVS